MSFLLNKMNPVVFALPGDLGDKLSQNFFQTWISLRVPGALYKEKSIKYLSCECKKKRKRKKK